ncbi:MAG: hypothetical protein ACE361_16270 [Aureliella sp.]
MRAPTRPTSVDGESVERKAESESACQDDMGLCETAWRAVAYGGQEAMKGLAITEAGDHANDASD